MSIAMLNIFMGLKAKLRIDKKCNKCGIILPFRAFRKKKQ